LSGGDFVLDSVQPQQKLQIAILGLYT